MERSDNLLNCFASFGSRKSQQTLLFLACKKYVVHMQQGQEVVVDLFKLLCMYGTVG